MLREEGGYCLIMNSCNFRFWEAISGNDGWCSRSPSFIFIQKHSMYSKSLVSAPLCYNAAINMTWQPFLFALHSQYPSETAKWTKPAIECPQIPFSIVSWTISAARACVTFPKRKRRKDYQSTIKENILMKAQSDILTSKVYVCDPFIAEVLLEIILRKNCSITSRNQK